MPTKTLDTGEKRLSEGRHMHAWVSLGPTGCTVKTRTRNRNEFTGFTGCVKVALSDRDGGILFQTPLEQHGVQALYLPGSSDRTVEELYEITPAVFDRVDRIDAVLMHARRNRVLEDVEIVTDALETVADWIAHLFPGGTPASGLEAAASSVQGLAPAPHPPKPKLITAAISPATLLVGHETMVKATAADSATSAKLTGSLYAAWNLPVTPDDPSDVLVGPLGTPLPFTLRGAWQQLKSRPGRPVQYVWTQQHLVAVVPGYPQVELKVTASGIPARPTPVTPAPPPRVPAHR